MRQLLQPITAFVYYNRCRLHCVRWGPTPKGAQAPRFSPHVCCGQTARC